jgi:hypothetical protein
MVNDVKEFFYPRKKKIIIFVILFISSIIVTFFGLIGMAFGGSRGIPPGAKALFYDLSPLLALFHPMIAGVLLLSGDINVFHEIPIALLLYIELLWLWVLSCIIFKILNLIQAKNGKLN